MSPSIFVGVNPPDSRLRQTGPVDILQAADNCPAQEGEVDKDIESKKPEAMKPKGEQSGDGP